MRVDVQEWCLTICQCGHWAWAHNHDDDPADTECGHCPLAFISERGHSPSKCSVFSATITPARQNP